MQLSPDGPYTSIGTQRGDPEDHEPIDRKRMARLSSQMSRSHHPVEKAMAPVPVRDARQSFPPFDGVFSPFKHGSIRHGRTARTADRAVLVELRRFLAGVHAHWDVPDVHSPISTHPRRSAFKIRLQGAVSSAMSRSRGSTFRDSGSVEVVERDDPLEAGLQGRHTPRAPG